MASAVDVRKGRRRAGSGFLAVVDVEEAAVGVGVDVAENLLGEVEDHAGIARAVAGDREARVGVLNVAADVALGIEDRQAALGTVDGDADHDAVRQLAGRDGPVGEGVLRGTCNSRWLLQEVRPSVATAIRRPQRIWAQKDWLRGLRFFNGKDSKPERCGMFCGHCYNAEYNKGRGGGGLGSGAGWCKGLEWVGVVA